MNPKLFWDDLHDVGCQTNGNSNSIPYHSVSSVENDERMGYVMA